MQPSITFSPWIIATCRFTENHFHGIRLSPEGAEECDWPPSPSRFYQAHVQAGLGGLAGDFLTESGAVSLDLLRWLETLPSPFIDAPQVPKVDLKPKFSLALPENSPEGTKLHESSKQLAPVRRVSSWDIAGTCDLSVSYHWDVSAVAPGEVERLLVNFQELASRVTYFGRAEDRVEIRVSSHENMPELATGQCRWLPVAHATGLQLPVPRPGTLAELMQRHRRKFTQRERKLPSSLCMSTQSYQEHRTIAMLQPVHIGLLRLRDQQDDEQALDPATVMAWQARIRHAVCNRFKEIKWHEEDLAAELICGHQVGGKPSEQPHLALVPLPSLSASGVADGLVRRFALVGYASPIHAAAKDIFETLARSLDGLPIKHAGQDTGLHISLEQKRPGQDKMWPQFSGSSTVWTTAFPIALSSFFKTSKCSPEGVPLNRNEQFLVRQAELARLIRRALIRQGLPTEAVAAAEIIPSASPFLLKTRRVEHYQDNGSRGFRIHARITFPCPVQGPLIIGDGRFRGMGLCFPC